MQANARPVVSNQVGVHPDLPKLLLRHQQAEFKRPIAEHTQRAFDAVVAYLLDWQGEVILDTCCGVGESTLNLARLHPQAKIIGVDKSIARLGKHHSYQAKQTYTFNKMSVDDEKTELNNYLLVQADLNDFWRLLSAYLSTQKPTWQLIKQTIFYPNPYPKKSQLGKRWHASAVMPFIVDVCKNIEVRSNWLLYLEEFLSAAEFYGLTGTIEVFDDEPITPFERKYQDAGQTCFKLAILP